MPDPMRTICRIIETGDDFLVASHVNPDGDALGSMAAMGWLLRALNKRFALYNASGVPEQFDWLSLPAPLTTEVPDPLPRWTLVLDCGNPARVGPDLASRLDPERSVNIDHHLGNPAWAAANWVDTAEPATGTMIARLADELGVPLAGPLAEAVYTALVTDTGFFTYGSTTPESLELAARLMRGGLDAAGLNARITAQWTPRRLRLWSEVLSAVEVTHQGQVAATGVTREMFERTGTTAQDTEDLINFVRGLRGVRVAVLLREEAPGRYKFSLRSHGPDNVQAVAAGFGGGGHRNASGGQVEAADMETAKSMLVDAAASELGIA